MNKEKIAVFFSLDKDFLIPATVAIFSLLKNHPKQSFRIYLVAEEFGIDWIRPLENLIEKMGSEPILKPINGQAISKLKVNPQLSHATYYRVLAPSLFQESKIIYLDSDLLVHGDISELWELDLEDFPIAAVEDPFTRDLHRLGLTEDQGYFNSGVLLMNLDQWRKMNLGDLVLDFAFNNPAIIPYLDQCSLNAVLKGNWLRLEPKWNLQTGMVEKEPSGFFNRFFSEQSLLEANQNPRIIHFTGAFKPWKPGCKHPFKNLFWEYLNQIPNEIKSPIDFSWFRIKSWIPLSLNKFYWKLFKERKSMLLSGTS